MRHYLYTGPFAALEIRWMERIADLQKNDVLSPVPILVGSNILASYLKQRIVEEGRAIANLRFYTFLDLAGHLAAVAEIHDSRPRLPHLGALEILRETLSLHTPARFAQVATLRGFQDAVLSTFRDLRDAGVKPGALELSARSPLGLASDRACHLLDLANLYRQFHEKVCLFRDVDDDFRDAALNVAAAGKLLGTEHLLVYGIYDVTGQQGNLLSCLKETLEMTYFVPFVDNAVSGFARPFVEQCARDLGVKEEALSESNRSDNLGRMCRLGFGWVDALGEAPTVSHVSRHDPPADGSFGMVSAPGESRMAVEIVREILRSLQEGAIAGFHEAAVLLRQPESQVPVITEAFRLRGIPYYLQGGSPFTDRPLGKAVLALAELESLLFSRQAILNAMELIEASLPAAEAAAWDVQQWRVLTNDARFLAGEDSWDLATEALIEETRADLRKAGVQTNSADVQDTADRHHDGVPSKFIANARAEAAGALRTAWQALRLASQGWPASLLWKEWSSFLERHLHPILGCSEDWDTLANVLDALATLDDVAGRACLNPQVSRSALLSALRESISSLSCMEGRFGHRGVNLLPITAARGLRIPLVLIPGLEEGRFPARLRQDPLLLDAERSLIGGLPLKSGRSDEERLLFDMSARSAVRRLRLMTSRLDEDSGRERVPSQFFLRAAAAARGSRISLRDLTEDTIPGFRSIGLENPAPRDGELPVDATEIRLQLITGSHSSRWEALSALAVLDPILLTGPMAYDRSRWMRILTDFDGRLSSPDLLRWISQEARLPDPQISASQVEEYAKCPYLFYLKRIMRLDPWEEQGPAQGMTPLVRGSVIHSILEDFLTRNPGEAFGETPIDVLRASLMARSKQYLERARPGGVPDLLWEIERDSLLAMLDNWLKYEKDRLSDELIPTLFEQAFGAMSSEQQFPFLRIRAGKYTFDFRGRIDRIDLSRDRKRARVIDYKTGALPVSMKGGKRTPLMSGERVQLAVYRQALSVLSGLGEVESVEGEYLHLQPREGKTTSCNFDDGDLSIAAQNLPSILEVFGDGIERGVFFARTSGSIRPTGHCGTCDYLPICGKDRNYREERKAGDPAVLHFLKIQENDETESGPGEDA